jgi:hypothetical protein
MNIDKNTRLIDLTLADLMVIVKECMTGFMLVDETLNIGLPGGGIRFSKKMLMNWLLSHQKLTHREIQEKAETLKLKRKLRRK